MHFAFDFGSRAAGMGALSILGSCALVAGTLVGCGADGAWSSGRAYDGESGTGSGAGSGGGLLTAGAWDDNANYEIFAGYRAAREDDPISTEEHDAAHATFGGARDAHDRLDVALVIDTTGSMGDELSYLQTELDAIATQVTGAYPDAETRWALVLYRDQGDEYETRVFGFDHVDAIRGHLARQSAGGGGDYPEASHAALRDAAALAWRQDADVARVLFWIADAPHHVEEDDVWAEAVRSAAQLDVHVYPIASSGVDGFTELSMRSAAQLTGGRYLFLTDDSGIGGSHLEPTIPCYVVTHLDDAMIRSIDAEMSGAHVLPASSEILRTAGDPDEHGVCAFDDDAVAYAF